jgi:hypothetical protein
VGAGGSDRSAPERRDRTVGSATSTRPGRRPLSFRRHDFGRHTGLHKLHVAISNVLHRGTRARETSGKATTSGDRDTGSGSGGRSLNRAPDGRERRRRDGPDPIPVRVADVRWVVATGLDRAVRYRLGRDERSDSLPPYGRHRSWFVSDRPYRRSSNWRRRGSYPFESGVATAIVDRRHLRRRSLEASHWLWARGNRTGTVDEALRRPAVSRRSRTRNRGRTCTDRRLSIADQSGGDAVVDTARGPRAEMTHIILAGHENREGRHRTDPDATPRRPRRDTTGAPPGRRRRPHEPDLKGTDSPGRNSRSAPPRPSGRSVSTDSRTRSRQTGRWYPSDWPTVAGPTARGSQPPGRGASRPAAGPLPSFHRRGLPGRPRRGPPARAGPRPVA